jgi:hypothetical protein
MNPMRMYPVGILDREPDTRRSRDRVPFTIEDAERLLPLLARALYPTPNRHLSVDQYEREHHLDLDGMPLEYLKRERKRAALRELLDDNPDVWVYDRLVHLDAAISRGERAARG